MLNQQSTTQKDQIIYALMVPSTSGQNVKCLLDSIDYF